MYSKSCKLRILKEFFVVTPRSQLLYSCPFGKDGRSHKPAISLRPCSELCGAFKELGDVGRGCPCETLGTQGSISQLEYLLRKEGWLNSIGEDI